MRILATSLMLVGLAIADPTCRFAPLYSQQSLLNNENTRNEFLQKVISAEARFMKEIGYDQRTGLTLDGQPLDIRTGMPKGPAHQYTAASKESLHVAILAKALNGEKDTDLIYTKEEALDILTKKIDTYEKFAKEYPGFGGFLPWIHVNETHVSPQKFDWTDGVPALDNGQLFWAAYGLTHVLEEKYPEQKDLLLRWSNFYQTMIANSIPVFYEGNGNIRQVTVFDSYDLPVEKNTYRNWKSNCSLFDNPCYLDDPYEGELFTTMMYLFAPFENEAEREQIWINKRAKLQPVEVKINELDQKIVAQKGWWYSAHEQWKYFFLPYLDSEVNRKVFENGEKLRTWDAKQNNLPGMFASVTGTIKDNKQEMVYISDSGIPEAAYAAVNHREVVTSYSTMALFLADKKTATAWYHNMLMGPAGQTQYGSVESIHINGQEVSPLTTWDSKITTVLAILGGFSDVVKQKLQKDDTYQKFINSVNNEWSQVFSDQLVSNDISYALPITNIPQNREDFTSCRLRDFPDDFAFGTATAAFQIEGAAKEDGRGPSIWDDLCAIPGRIANNDNGDVADDFYHKYLQDIAMIKSLGLKHFRLSLSWSRILPDGTIKTPNPKGVDFYNKVLDALIAADIEPWVTLFHWDLPSALQDKSDTGAWLGTKIIDQFNDYADYCFQQFGGKVKRWLTFNEPWTFTWLGYGSGLNAPGRCTQGVRDDCNTVGGGGNTATEPYIVTHHVILAHATAVKTYRDKYQQAQGGKIGWTLNTDFGEPFDPSNPDDLKATDIKTQFSFGWYMDPIVFGKYPDVMIQQISNNRLPTFTADQVKLIQGSYDFIGLNHYTSTFSKKVDTPGTAWDSDMMVQSSQTDVNGVRIGPLAQSVWLSVYPPGMRKLLKWIDDRYSTDSKKQEIVVFENGVSVPGENDMSIADAVHDLFRVDFYKGYIKNMRDAITLDGVNVKGYFAWSLMDNFEWADGYSVRFGMTYVDYKNNQARYLKDSAFWYSQFIRTHNINGEYYNPYYEQLKRQEKKFLTEATE